MGQSLRELRLDLAVRSKWNLGFFWAGLVFWVYAAAIGWLSRRQAPLIPSGYPLRHTDRGMRPVPPSLQTGKYLTCGARRSFKPWIRPFA